MLQKKRLITSLEKLPQEALEALREKYPYGYADYVMKIDKGNNDGFYAIPLETDEVSYLVKVNVKVDDLEELNSVMFDDDDDDSGSSGGDSDIIPNTEEIEIDSNYDEEEESGSSKKSKKPAASFDDDDDDDSYDDPFDDDDADDDEDFDEDEN